MTQLNDGTAWTPELENAYYTFELVGDGVDATTPSPQIHARTKDNALPGYDAAAVTFEGFGVAALGATGTDLLGVIEQFLQAQSG